MNQYRITKYNPRYRNPDGTYIKDEWTSVTDIGKKIENLIFTKDEYLKTESAYIETALRFLNGSALNARGVENSAKSELAPSEGEVLEGKALSDVCRGVLREEFWCRLESKDRFVHFGWDYHMYIGTKKSNGDGIEFAEANGLFVEEFESPYLTKNEQSVLTKRAR